jgi:nucleotide-binding universal stress UspA family protein
VSIFSRILVAIDYGEQAREGLILGARLADEHGGELHLVHAINWAPLVSEIASTAQPVDAGVVTDGLNKRAQTLIASATKLAKTYGVAATTHVGEGRPSEVVLKTASEIGCTLIVMGTHGRKGLDLAFLGSSTNAVLRLSSLPVLTIRPGEHTAAPPRRIFERILVGIDDSGPSDAAVATVLTMPPEDRQQLTFCSVADEHLMGAWTEVESGMVQVLQADAQSVVNKALAVANDGNVRADGYVLAGSPTDALLNFAVQKQVDLIVVGSHGRRGAQRVILGSLAEALVRTAPVPVLVVRGQAPAVTAPAATA